MHKSVHAHKARLQFVHASKACTCGNGVACNDTMWVAPTLKMKTSCLQLLGDPPSSRLLFVVACLASYELRAKMVIDY